MIYKKDCLPWRNFKEIKEYNPGVSIIEQIEAKKAVSIKAVDNGIQVCGTELGKSIQLYDTNGMLLGTAKAGDGEATLLYELQHEQIYIICYGDKAIKFRY